MSVPTFYHTSVLLHEAIEGLCIREGGVYVDATYGGGGHSREILKRVGQSGRLIAFDQDEDAWQNAISDDRLIAVKENFRFMKRFLKLFEYAAIDGILADLGVSSFQFDTAERGFSTRFNGPMDMRMDQRLSLTARDILLSYSSEELHQLFEIYGEVRNAKQLAKHIVDGRSVANMQHTEAFKAFIAPVVKGQPHRYFAQVFQALRIEVNDEMGALQDLLQQSTDLLMPGGRICIITFHSIEDRLVKQFFKSGHQEYNEQLEIYGARAVYRPFDLINDKPIEPSEQEIESNPRARSARLRIASKKSAPA